MKTRYWNNPWPHGKRLHITGAIFLAFLFIAMLTDQVAVGADMLSSDNNGGDIHISSDELIARSKANYAEFSGNVHAVNEDVDITADNLKVFYEQASPSEAPAEAEGGDITTGKTVREIVATGNVVIKFNQRTAVTDKAIYTRDTGKIVMTGADSKITGEGGYIAGEKITLHTVTEQVTVESGDSNRVEAVINSNPAGTSSPDGKTPDQDS